jgi:predicted DNA-binding transcriptional regulator AlpA
MKFQSPQPENDNGSLWDAKDVAAFLKVSRSWVYHRSEAGLLPCVRIGSLLRFDPEVIRRLVRVATATTVA